MIFNKLVRDNIIELMLEEGKTVKYKTLVGEELVRALFDKLIEEKEELEEAIKSKDVEAILEEVVDILTVLESIRAELGITNQEIINLVKNIDLESLSGIDLDFIPSEGIIYSEKEEQSLILDLVGLQLSVVEIAIQNNINMEEMLKYKNNKRKSKGGYFKGVFLMEVLD